MRVHDRIVRWGEAARRAMDWRMHPDAQNMPLPLWQRRLASALADSPESTEA
jgi:hypothetical protein